MNSEKVMSGRRYWWVSHNKTHKQEVDGGYLWSPKVKVNGQRNQCWDYMKEVRPGDVVLSFCKQHISAVGVAVAAAVTAPKPDFGKAGEGWAQEGWLVEVDFKKLPAPFSPKINYENIRELLPVKYSPLTTKGTGQQNYLFEISDALYGRLNILIGAALSVAPPAFAGEADQLDAEEAHLKGVEGRTDIGPTQRRQLVEARRGQGIFRDNLYRNEKRCRVTGVSDERVLIASHIKAWAESNDVEKLHGCNGLMLSPHVDKLFDKGFISFSDQGELLLSPKMGPGVLAAWGIAFPLNVGSFLLEQRAFLAHHRCKYKFSV